MDIASHRKDFIIYVSDDETSILDILKETLSTAGYQVEIFPSGDLALERVKVAPPHLMFSDIRMPGITGIQLLQKVKELSRDIEFIIMTSHATIETAVDAMKFGAYDYIFKPFENLEDIVKTADRTIEHVYMRLQNEQLMAELADKNKLLNEANARISQEKHEIQLINEFMQKLTQKLDPEGVCQVFLEAISGLIGGKPVLLFRYIATYKSLAAIQASNFPLERIRGLGINLASYEPNQIPGLLKAPEKIPSLQELMSQVFKVSEYEAFPLIHQGQAIGVFIAFEKFREVTINRLVSSFSQIMSVSFDNSMLVKRVHEMAVKDPLTTLYNRRFFNEKMEDEIQRSRRTHYPLSLIYMDIDHFKKYNDTNGHPMGDVILKMVAQILSKSSRKTDVVARLGGEEFAIICPHTSLQGAAVKAEKVRVSIESTVFPNGEKQPLGKVTVSLGVSEYPSLVRDGESLIRCADDALYKVKQAGRNRVVLGEAAQDFKPDFVPLEVPAAAPSPRR